MHRRAFLATATATAIAFGTTFGVGTAQADALVVNAPVNGFLDLRTGPGTGFDIIYAMPHGSEVHTLEWSGRWVRVQHESGRTGWCTASELVRMGS